MPPSLLAATACAVAFVLRGPDQVFGIAAAVLFGLAILWILISVFSPARAERICSSCGAEALRRLDPQTTRGIICAACGFVDEQHSAFLLAEEEGPLEPIVLRERALRRVDRPAERAI